MGTLTAPTIGADTFDLGQMRDYFKKLSGGPYVYLQTPRTGLGVGTIYVIKGKSTYYITRPEDCFAQSVLGRVTSSAKPVTGTLESKYSLDAGLKVVPVGPITNELKVGLSKNGVSSVVVTIPSLQQKVITLAELRKAFTDQAIDAECRASLNSPDRWLVIETLSAKDYSVSLKRSGGMSGTFDVGLFKLLFPNFKGDMSKAASGTVEFANADPPYIVAIKALKFSDTTRFASDDKMSTVVDPSDYFLALAK
jgi:hypothetical protein